MCIVSPGLESMLAVSRKEKGGALVMYNPDNDTSEFKIKIERASQTRLEACKSLPK